MKKKILFSAVLSAGLLFYVVSFVATSVPDKIMPTDPCFATAKYWFNKDSTRRYSYLQLLNSTDSLLIRADTLYSINWNLVCDSICIIYKDSCNRTGQAILVVNYRDTARSTWDTHYGRKILFRKCP